MTRPAEPITPRTAHENIATVIRLEEELMERRRPSDRLADAVGSFIGSIRFVILQLSACAAWITINVGWLPVVRPFDPYPFPLLSTVVCLEAVLLSTLVVVKQNLMSRRAEHRDHLNLQIDLLAEREITKVLQTLQAINDRLGIGEPRGDPELQELSRHTAVDELARNLREQLPDE